MAAKEITGKGIEIKWGANPMNTSVYIDGQDISRYVRSMTLALSAQHREPTIITLECYAMNGTPEQTIRGRLFIDEAPADPALEVGYGWEQIQRDLAITRRVKPSGN